MAVLASTKHDINYYKYGTVNTHRHYTHEMALRMVLHTISTVANRYKKSIEPLLSLTVDFYIRLFIRVKDGPIYCHNSIENQSLVFQCDDCQNFHLHQLGENNAKRVQK